jgi:mitogen-activated protein kinase kinase kinase
MRQLSHVNIVNYLGVEAELDQCKCYIFCEWVPGGSVQSMIDQWGPFEESVVRKYVHECGRSVGRSGGASGTHTVR